MAPSTRLWKLLAVGAIFCLALLSALRMQQGILGGSSAPTTRSTASPDPAAEEADQSGPQVGHSLLSSARSGDGGSCAAPSSFQPLGDFQFFGKRANASSPCPTSGMNNQLVMLVALIHCAASRGTPVFYWKDISCSPTGGRHGREHGRYRVGSNDYEYAWFRWSEVFDLSAFFDSEPARLTTTTRRTALNDDGGAPIRLCFADAYTWGQNKDAIKKCPTTVERIYGSVAYWQIRRLLPLRQHFFALAERLLRDYGIQSETNDADATAASRRSGAQREDVQRDAAKKQRKGERGLLQAIVDPDHEEATRALDDASRSPKSKKKENDDDDNATDDEEERKKTAQPVAEKKQQQQDAAKDRNVKVGQSSSKRMMPLVAIHVRKGDYAHFCKQTARGSGVRKFRTAPFLWLRGKGRNTTTSLSGNFVDACAPATEKVVVGTRRVVDKAIMQQPDTAEAANAEAAAAFVYVASNSPEILNALSEGFSTSTSTGKKKRKRVGVISLKTWVDDKVGGQAKLGDVLAQVGWPRSFLSVTDKVVLDIVLLALADHAVLNRYSTFSQSAIDFRFLRDGHLRSYNINWW